MNSQRQSVDNSFDQILPTPDAESEIRNIQVIPLSMNQKDEQKSNVQKEKKDQKDQKTK